MTELRFMLICGLFLRTYHIVDILLKDVETLTRTLHVVLRLVIKVGLESVDFVA
jgi:hypothetical protein